MWTMIRSIWKAQRTRKDTILYHVKNRSLVKWSLHGERHLKGALYRIWCGVNRLSDSGVKVV